MTMLVVVVVEVAETRLVVVLYHFRHIPFAEHLNFVIAYICADREGNIFAGGIFRVNLLEFVVTHDRI